MGLMLHHWHLSERNTPPFSVMVIPLMRTHGRCSWYWLLAKIANATSSRDTASDLGLGRHCAMGVVTNNVIATMNEFCHTFMAGTLTVVPSQKTHNLSSFFPLHA